ncbi:MAG: hypothetical protein KKB50_10095 [Planctomycetes bacterium]|nr:hypothetical protein [Planctomycetota bacterium]
MSDREFEAYLMLLSRCLRLSAAQRDEIRRELRAHLEEAVEAEQAGGATREQALLRALEDFGDAAELAARFNRIGRKRRWIMRGTAAAACIGFGALLVTTLTPEVTPSVAAGPGALSGNWLVQERLVPPTEADEIDPDEAIFRALEEVIPDVVLQDTPLETVIEFLCDLAHMNVHVQWRQLEESGVDRDQPISIKLKNISTARVLQLALDDAGGDVDLAFDVQDGVLLITTREMLERHYTTRVYNVRDLIESATIWQKQYAEVAEQQHEDDVAPEPAGNALEEAEERFLEMLWNLVEPETWEENGGRARAAVFSGVLVVYQSDRTHELVMRLLHDLRSEGLGEHD